LVAVATLLHMVRLLHKVLLLVVLGLDTHECMCMLLQYFALSIDSCVET